mmetsp:Transcript_78736/g.236033  ORF Transcript_78736/g.236033 Transcript_78736/m.236033 type:complete len:200 (-) Transcript_78736:1126-1725(-)
MGAPTRGQSTLTRTGRSTLSSVSTSRRRPPLRTGAAAAALSRRRSHLLRPSSCCPSWTRLPPARPRPRSRWAKRSASWQAAASTPTRWAARTTRRASPLSASGDSTCAGTRPSSSRTRASDRRRPSPPPQSTPAPRRGACCKPRRWPPCRLPARRTRAKWARPRVATRPSPPPPSRRPPRSSARAHSRPRCSAARRRRT